MDIKEIRRENLRHQQELAARAGINKADFAEKCGTSAPTLSQILSPKGNRNLGDELARKIENALSLPFGWMDITHQEVRNLKQEPEAREIGRIRPWDSSTAMADDDIELPFLKEVQLAGGVGCSIQEDYNGYKLRFAKSTLKRLGVEPDNAVCVEVYGSSMEPVLPNGAVVGVDKGSTSIKDGMMYAIDHGDLLRVKVLQALPGGRVRIRSYNADEYPEEVCDQADVTVLGRVFWSSVTY